MYHVSALGVDERVINVHYYYYYYPTLTVVQQLERWSWILPSPSIKQHRATCARKGKPTCRRVSNRSEQNSRAVIQVFNTGQAFSFCTARYGTRALPLHTLHLGMLLVAVLQRQTCSKLAAGEPFSQTTALAA